MTTRRARIDPAWENAIRKLVESKLQQCGFESEFFRHCLALVEHSDGKPVERHGSDCPCGSTLGRTISLLLR